MENSEASAQGLTERQQFLLDHIARCDAAACSTKACASEQGLSVQAMDSAHNDLPE
jgi:hypothetical protein